MVVGGEEGKQQKCGGGEEGRITEMLRWRENNKNEEKDEQEGWVSKTLSSVLKRASLPSHSLICTICAPRIIEPKLGQSQRQIIKLT